MTSKRFESGILALRSAGMKLTPQRLAVLEQLVDDETHPTAQELYDRLRKRFPTMSVATVYNTLSALDAIGYCRRIELGGSSRFDPNVDTHDHALCERCGSMRDIAAVKQPRRQRLRGLPGFRVARVERIYRGLCAQCTSAA
jgi:Fur family peroxide stress response transcriptional regulator